MTILVQDYCVINVITLLANYTYMYNNSFHDNTCIEFIDYEYLYYTYEYHYYLAPTRGL